MMTLQTMIRPSSATIAGANSADPATPRATSATRSAAAQSKRLPLGPHYRTWHRLNGETGMIADEIAESDADEGSISSSGGSQWLWQKREVTP